MTLTDAAVERVKKLMAMTDKPVLGVRVGVTQQGCSGMSYKMEYAEDERPGEEIIEDKGVKVFVEPTATMFLQCFSLARRWIGWKISSSPGSCSIIRTPKGPAAAENPSTFD
jgi:iron-sulfur cluster assembly accessory protein